MKAEKVFLKWAEDVNNIEDIVKNHQDDIINSLLDFNFIKNGNEDKSDISFSINPDKSIYKRHLEGFINITVNFGNVLNDTIFGNYACKYTDKYQNIYNCICYSLLMRDVERIPTLNETKEKLIKLKLKHGFIDVLERMYNISKNEKLANLYKKMYKNAKEHMSDYYYLCDIDNILDEKSMFSIFLTLKEKVRSSLCRDLISNTHEFDRGDINFYSDMISMSAYFAEVLSINYLSEKFKSKISDGKLLSDFYFNDLTKEYSFEVVG